MGRIKISGVMAVHNEAEYLRYSLPALKTLGLNEIIFVLDRCTDNSLSVIKRYAPHNSYILIKKWQHWTQTRAGETFQYGFDYATHDIVFALGADLILSRSAFALTQHYMKKPCVGSVSFGFQQYSLQSRRQLIHSTYINCVQHFINHLNPYRRTFYSTGVYCFRKHLAKLEDEPAEYFNLHRRIKDLGYQHIHIPNSNIIHLRPGFTKEKQMWHGETRARRGEPFLRTALYSLLKVRPWTLIAFFKHRQ